MVETSPLGILKVLAPVPHVPATYAPVLMAQSLGYAAAEGLDLQVVAHGSPRESIAGCVAGVGIGSVNWVFNFLIRDPAQAFRSFFSIPRKRNRSFAPPARGPVR